VVGMQDQTVPPHMADEACRAIRQAHIHQLPRLGHLAHEEDPAGTASLLLKINGLTD
jgi:magnesium chelatase accessory protein